MTISPFAREADRLNKEAKQPADNWRARRLDAIRMHEISAEAVASTINTMGHVLLEDRVSTDLRMHGKNNVENTNPSDRLAVQYFTIIPTIYGSDTVLTDEHHSGWQPETAMNIALLLEDRYDNSDKTQLPQPTGDVGLSMEVRTWGKLSDEDEAVINALPGTWSEYGDRGYNRKGTLVKTTRQPGEFLTTEQIETILTPLAEHIIKYADIVNVPERIRKTEKAGNFSTSKRVARRPVSEEQWRGYTAKPTRPEKALALNSLRLTGLS